MALDWDDFRYVLALRRAGSLGAAARQLKVDQSTAGRRLAALESELGVQLVLRTPEGVTLTEAGVAAAALAETIERGVDELVRAVGDDDSRPEGVVKLATTDSSAAFLMGGLVPLRDQYPNLRVELVVSNTAHDLVRREADIALRMFRDTSPTLITRKVGDFGWSIYAAPAFIARHQLAVVGALDRRWLSELPWVGFADDAIGRSPGGVWLTNEGRPAHIAMRVNSIASLVSAARAGVGLAVVPCFTVHGATDLVRLTSDVVATSEAFLVQNPDCRHIARVRIVADAVIALVERERAMLAGAMATA